MGNQRNSNIQLHKPYTCNSFTCEATVFFFRFPEMGWDWANLVRWPLIGILYHPRMIDDDECGAVGGMRIGRGNRSIRRKPVTVSLCPPQFPHDQTRARTRAAALGSRRVTAWAMARPCPLKFFFCSRWKSNPGLPTRSPSLYRLSYTGSGEATMLLFTRRPLRTRNNSSSLWSCETPGLLTEFGPFWLLPPSYPQETPQGKKVYEYWGGHISCGRVVGSRIKKNFLGWVKERGGPGSKPGLVIWNLWWTKWHWGRFSPSTSVSPVNLHSNNISTITTTYHPGLVQ
jgi:hypothetical protein